jgi:hypothetical protein
LVKLGFHGFVTWFWIAKMDDEISFCMLLAFGLRGLTFGWSATWFSG